MCIIRIYGSVCFDFKKEKIMEFGSNLSAAGRLWHEWIGAMNSNLTRAGHS